MEVVVVHEHLLLVLVLVVVEVGRQLGFVRSDELVVLTADGVDGVVVCRERLVCL